MNLSSCCFLNVKVYAPFHWPEFWTGIITGAVFGIIGYETILLTCLK
jgi:hypothetical protein